MSYPVVDLESLLEEARDIIEERLKIEGFISEDQP